MSTLHSVSVSDDCCRRSSSLAALRIRPSRARSTSACAAGSVALYAATVALTSTSPACAIRKTVPALRSRALAASSAARSPTACCTRVRTSPVTGAPPCEKYASSASGGGPCVRK